jgi:superfamily II DNA or RNA helicase
LITLKNEIRITDLTQEETNTIKDDLTITNPLWENAVKMQLSLWGVPKNLQYFKEIDGGLKVPIGYLDTLKTFLPHHSIIDERFISEDSQLIEFTGKLKPYQESAVLEMSTHSNGVLVAKGGAGKTVMMIKMICMSGQPTLILTHTKELANQFIDRLTQFTNLTREDVGFLGSGQFNLKPVTVALMQTLIRRPISELQTLPFGMVFVDEVQIVPADTYTEIISNIPAKYKYGASGTPARSDGLTQVIFWLTGPIRYTVPDSALEGSILTASIKVIPTNYYFPLLSSSEYTSMITDLSNNEERNNLILAAVAEYPTQQMALLCQRLEQVDWLHNHIPDSAILTSKMSNKDRAQVMTGLNAGTHRIVITTYPLFKLGIDLSELEVLFFCAPIKDKYMVTQCAWRLIRLSKKGADKKPIIVDFADMKVDMLKYQFYNRQRTLKKEFKQ